MYSRAVPYCESAVEAIQLPPVLSVLNPQLGILDPQGGSDLAAVQARVALCKAQQPGQLLGLLLPALAGALHLALERPWEIPDVLWVLHWAMQLDEHALLQDQPQPSVYVYSKVTRCMVCTERSAGRRRTKSEFSVGMHHMALP